MKGGHFARIPSKHNRVRSDALEEFDCLMEEFTIFPANLQIVKIQIRKIPVDPFRYLPPFIPIWDEIVFRSE